jgi:hypothetical protein
MKMGPQRPQRYQEPARVRIEPFECPVIATVPGGGTSSSSSRSKHQPQRSNTTHHLGECGYSLLVIQGAIQGASQGST